VQNTSKTVKAAIESGYTESRRLTNDELMEVVEYFRSGGKEGNSYGLSEDTIGRIWNVYTAMSDYNSTADNPINLTDAIDLGKGV
jgi:hypothetical protein